MLITGATGSGKTTFAQQFVEVAPRAVILDFYGDWERDGAIVTFDFAQAIDFLLADSEKTAPRLGLIFRNPDVEQSLKLLEFANTMQQHTFPKHGKSLVFVHEEAWRFSTPQKIPAVLHSLYTGARRWRAANIAIMQRDVNVNPTIRAMSQVTCAFQNMKLSDDTKQLFGARAEQIPTLAPIVYPNFPKENVNYFQVPTGDKIDVLDWWKKAVL
jgi:hypothetical protein